MKQASYARVYDTLRTRLRPCRNSDSERGGEYALPKIKQNEA